MSDDRLDPSTPEWGEALETWRMTLWKLKTTRLHAYDKRGHDEQTVRRLRRELAAAEVEFAASDAEAKDLQRQVDEMLQDGESKGFTP